jgi:sRNA-binding regulator protein Hfq
VNGKGNIKNGNDRGDPKRRPGGGKPPSQSARSRAPEQTFEEVRYLKHLIENEIPIRVRLRDNSEVAGTIEYYDHSFIRLTRHNAPNLFIFKHEIKYLYEE